MSSISCNNNNNLKMVLVRDITKKVSLDYRVAMAVGDWHGEAAASYPFRQESPTFVSPADGAVGHERAAVQADGSRA